MIIRTSVKSFQLFSDNVITATVTAGDSIETSTVTHRRSRANKGGGRFNFPFFFAKRSVSKLANIASRGTRWHVTKMEFVLTGHQVRSRDR
jgi:hypothetical protein